MNHVDQIPVLTLILTVGLALRLTRLAIADTLTQPLRDGINRLSWNFTPTGTAPIPAVIRWPAGVLDKLLSCKWCGGFWISAAVVVSALVWGEAALWQYTAAAFTVSHLVGVLPGVED